MYATRFAFVLFLTVVAGCSSDDKFPLPTRDVPTTKDEKGWPIYEHKAEGFAISLPADWVAIDLNPEMLDRTLKEGLKANAELAQFGDVIRQQVATGLKFMGVAKKNFAANYGPFVSVMKMPLEKGDTTKSFADEAAAELRTLTTVEGKVDRSSVTLKAGQAERLHFVMAMQVKDGRKIRVASTVYVIAKGNTIYNISVGIAAEKEAESNTATDAVVQSFRFMGN